MWQYSLKPNCPAYGRDYVMVGDFIHSHDDLEQVNINPESWSVDEAYEDPEFDEDDDATDDYNSRWFVSSTTGEHVESTCPFGFVGNRHELVDGDGHKLFTEISDVDLELVDGKWTWIGTFFEVPEAEF